MKTQIIKIDDVQLEMPHIEAAAKILRDGGLVAFPTETVYGIGANALNQEAILKIYTAKGRPSDNPLIVHIANKQDVFLYAKEVSPLAERLMDNFWPGPLTLIFRKTALISPFITGGLETVAIRLPANEIARSIIHHSGYPIAAPSANRSGKPSPTRAKHVIEDLEGRVDMIIDGGKAQIGLESTVLDVSGDTPIILRPGSITQEMIEKIVGPVLLDKALLDEKTVPRSPGMKYKHYAPKGQLTVVLGEDDQAHLFINGQILAMESKGHKVAVIATNEEQMVYNCQQVMLIGARDNPEEIASNLFKLLRRMDEEKIDFIYTRVFSEQDIGMATMNRLMKAAGNHLVTL